MPSARNHRPAVLKNYRRKFSLACLAVIGRSEADWKTREFASAAAHPEQGARILGCTFDIPLSELPAYLEREHRYRFRMVRVQERISTDENHYCNALVCFSTTDDEYHSRFASEEEYQRLIGDVYSGQLWNDPTIRPGRRYLIRCIRAACTMGPRWLFGFLFDTSLVDGTGLADYIVNHSARFKKLEAISVIAKPCRLQEHRLGSGCRAHPFVIQDNTELLAPAAAEPLRSAPPAATSNTSGTNSGTNAAAHAEEHDVVNFGTPGPLQSETPSCTLSVMKVPGRPHLPQRVAGSDHGTEKRITAAQADLPSVDTAFRERKWPAVGDAVTRSGGRRQAGHGLPAHMAAGHGQIQSQGNDQVECLDQTDYEANATFVSVLS